MKRFLNNYPEYRIGLFSVILVITLSIMAQVPFIGSLMNFFENAFMKSPFIGFFLIEVLLLSAFFWVMFLLKKDKESFDKMKNSIIIVFSILIGISELCSLSATVIKSPDATVFGTFLIETVSLVLAVLAMKKVIEEN